MNKNRNYDKGGYGNKPNKSKKSFKKTEELPFVVYYDPVFYQNPENQLFDVNNSEIFPQYIDPNPHFNPHFDPNFNPNFNPNFYPHFDPNFNPNFKELEPDNIKKEENNKRKELPENRAIGEYKEKIECLEDLIKLGNEIEHTNFSNISLNQEHLLNINDSLIKLKELIGMDSIKKNIFNQLIFFLQDIEPQFPHMLHTCIDGPPGCGKTELANILAHIYANLGIIQESKVVIARRSDLVAGYLGQTAQKTQEMIDSAKGGVLLIDEAYSLGNEEKKDSFAKECIDTLNQNLTEGKGDFICVIAGYKEDLEKSFFGFNSGLERRFPYRFSIEEYDAEQLTKIYKSILKKNDWLLEDNEEKDWLSFFKENRDSFKFNGGDLENLVHFSKLAYARNRIFSSAEHNKVIRLDDLKRAFEMYLSNKKKDKIIINMPPAHMYF